MATSSPHPLLPVWQASDDEMKKKNNVISRLEEKTNQITATMKQLEQR